jgi:pentatricopeptide repeat domain-containing protein 1
VCLKCNELDLALDIYGQMLSEGCTPNLVTFNTLLDVYAKTGHYAEALGVLGQLDMQARARPGVWGWGWDGGG